MKLQIFLVLLLSLFSINAAAEQASAESIKKLMQQTGAGEMGVQVMNQLLPALKQMAPGADDAFWQKFMANVNSDDLINMTVPIYQKYLEQKDVEALNRFYATPVGQKLIRVQPMIVQESVMVGQKWGQQLARKVVEQHQNAGSTN